MFAHVRINKIARVLPLCLSHTGEKTGKQKQKKFSTFASSCGDQLIAQRSVQHPQTLSYRSRLQANCWSPNYRSRACYHSQTDRGRSNNNCLVIQVDKMLQSSTN